MAPFASVGGLVMIYHLHGLAFCVLFTENYIMTRDELAVTWYLRNMSNVPFLKTFKGVISSRIARRRASYSRSTKAALSNNGSRLERVWKSFTSNEKFGLQRGRAWPNAPLLTCLWFFWVRFWPLNGSMGLCWTAIILTSLHSWLLVYQDFGDQWYKITWPHASLHASMHASMHPSMHPSMHQSLHP